MFSALVSVLLLAQVFANELTSVWHCAGAVSLNVTASQASELFGGCDGGSILRIALDFANGGDLSQQSISALHLWPPGLSALEAIALLVGGKETPIALWVIGYVVFLLIFAFTLLFVVLQKRGLWYVGFLLPVLLIFSSPLYGWILKSGLMYQEGFALSFFVIALTLASMADRSDSKKLKLRLAISSGLCLGLAAYFRSIFDPYILFLAGISFFMALAFVIRRIAHHKASWSTRKQSASLFLVITLSAVVLMLPWRIFLGTSIHKGDFSWTVLGETIWSSRWVTNEMLDSQGLGPWREGGFNAACQIDPKKCAFIQSIEAVSEAPYTGQGYFNQSDFRNFLVKSYLSKPVETFKFKLNVFSSFWNTNNTENYLGRNSPVEGSLFFLTTVLATFWSITRMKENYLLSWLWLSKLFITLSVLMVFHVEARYFIFLKIASVVVVALHLRSKRFVLKENEKTIAE